VGREVISLFFGELPKKNKAVVMELVPSPREIGDWRGG